MPTRGQISLVLLKPVLLLGSLGNKIIWFNPVGLVALSDMLS